MYAGPYLPYLASTSLKLLQHLYPTYIYIVIHKHSPFMMTPRLGLIL